MLCHWIHWIHWWLGSLTSLRWKAHLCGTFNHGCCHRARCSCRARDFGGPRSESQHQNPRKREKKWGNFHRFDQQLQLFSGKSSIFTVEKQLGFFSQLRARRVSKYVTCNNLEVESSILQWAISDWLKMLAGHTRANLNTAALLKNRDKLSRQETPNSV